MQQCSYAPRCSRKLQVVELEGQRPALDTLCPQTLFLFPVPGSAKANASPGDSTTHTWLIRDVRCSAVETLKGRVARTLRCASSELLARYFRTANPGMRAIEHRRDAMER